MKKILLLFCVTILLIMVGQITPTAADKSNVGSPVGALNSTALRSQPLLINHTTVDITAVPQQWIEAAKNDLHIYYGHTSHGSQLTTGMAGLVDFANGGGVGTITAN
jgi:hypothetical protein